MKLQNIFLRKDGDFVFEEDSKILVEEKKRIAGYILPVSLHDLIGIREHVQSRKFFRYRKKSPTGKSLHNLHTSKREKHYWKTVDILNDIKPSQNILQ